MKKEETILLTGASGMLGNNLLKHPFFEKYKFLTPSSLELDLKNFDFINNYLKKNKVQMVVHLAAKVGGIQANINNSFEFLVHNLELGKNLIIASKQNNIKKLINIASSCMYPKGNKREISEDLLLKGELEPTNEGYALSKIITTKLCEYVNQENKSYNYKTIVPCNLYGEYDNFDENSSHLVSSVIKKIDNAKNNNCKTVEVWGDGKARREFMYAGDMAELIFHAINNFESMPSIMNAGNGFDYSILEYYEEIAKVIKYDGTFIFNLEKPVGMERKLNNVERMKNWGWLPKTSLSEGIKLTYEYYRSIK